MLDSLSPELVLVPPPGQRAEAIRALPPGEFWRPSPAPARQAHARRQFVHVLLGTAALYFVARLALRIGAAALCVLFAVALMVGLGLLLCHEQAGDRRGRTAARMHGPSPRR